MDESSVYSKCKHVCDNNEDVIRMCMQIRVIYYKRPMYEWNI